MVRLVLQYTTINPTCNTITNAQYQYYTAIANAQYQYYTATTRLLLPIPILHCYYQYQYQYYYTAILIRLQLSFQAKNKLDSAFIPWSSQHNHRSLPKCVWHQTTSGGDLVAWGQQPKTPPCRCHRIVGTGGTFHA